MSEVDVIYLLDEWKIYPDKSQIERDGNIIHLEPKIMEVLVYLIQNANRVISREELTDKVWQSKFASDEVITRAISVLRKKLGDTGKVHRYIKTIPKHGYVLEYETELSPNIDEQTSIDSESEDVSSIDPIISRYISPKLALIISLVSIIIVISVVTMALKKMDPPKEVVSSEILINIKDIQAIDSLPGSVMVARVLSEQLLTTLSNSEFVGVNLNSHTDLDTSEVRSHNEYVISGGVKEVENEYQINIHFSDAQKGNVLWSQSFAGDKGAWHKLINNISKTIDHFITVASKENLDLNSLSLKELQASILTYQAQELRLEGSNNNLLLSIEMLQNALVTYPDNKDIIFQLALSVLLKQHHYSDSQDLEQIKQLLGSIESEQEMEGEYLFLAGFYGFKSNTLAIYESIELLEKAVQLIPDDIELMALLGDLYRVNAQPEKARIILNEAVSINQQYSLAIYNLAKLLSQQSENNRAISLIRSYLNNNANHLPLSHLLVQLYIGGGEFDKAINFLTKLIIAEESPILFEYLAQSYFYLFYATETQQQLIKIKPSSSPTVQYQRQCDLLNLQFLYQQAETICQQADLGADANHSTFFYAKNLLLQGKYEQAMQQYERSFSGINPDFNRLPVNFLIEEKVDYIWLLAKTEQQQATKLAKPILKYLQQANRLGYKGYGISDVILNIAAGEKQLANQLFGEAIEQGWLHWFDINYNGQHPALETVKQDSRFEQWKNYLQQTLNSQRQNVINAPKDQLPIFINGAD